METRAMAIAIFYAFGTALGGITGPAIFGALIAAAGTGAHPNPTPLLYGFILGAVLMIAAGIVQAFLGIEAAGRELEDIAAPLSARELQGEEDEFTLGRDQRIIRTTRAESALAGRTVADVMIKDPVTVDGGLSIRDFVEDVFLSNRYSAYPVTGDDGEISGIVSVREVLELPRDQWQTLKVRDKMHPAEGALVIDSGASLSDAFRELTHSDVHRALVSDNGRLHSLLSITDVARVFEVLAGEDYGFIGGETRGAFQPPPAAVVAPAAHNGSPPDGAATAVAEPPAAPTDTEE